MVSPQIAGVDALQLGMETRQTTFSVVLQVTGKSWAVELEPLRLGPRHCGHAKSAGPALSAVKAQTKTSANRNLRSRKRKTCL